MNTRRTTFLAMTVAAAMILSWLESMLPWFTGIPGIKVGLANIAVIFALEKFGNKEAFAVSLVRVFAMALLFGSVLSMLYSAAGAVLSLCVMILLKKTDRFSSVGVSVAGATAHNIGQILVAGAMMGRGLLGYYLPILLVSGAVSGIAVGLASAAVTERVRIPKS